MFFKGHGQTAIHWLDPLTGNAVAGRVPGVAQNHDYGRLPVSLKDQVREPVWSLGTNSAGLFIDFQTDADSILVRYTLKGSFAMPHMPSTGVSGLDLPKIPGTGLQENMILAIHLHLFFRI
ncbi:SGNH/GDSL hydrolase N-terminal domain-containing protein [Sphingobacterium spiritivorum]|uniref:SGNH/GDSL hydrolase N-terminal domain-containing protein n=1 Tax=Sphingobacterium spiritivorum TaxID=258 RepID=UPI003D15E7A0